MNNDRSGQVSADMNERPTITGAASRQSNLELLRILAIMCVILLHYNNENVGHAFEYVQRRDNYYLLYTLEILSAWPVNVIMMLSGYFMSTKTRADIKKPVALMVQLILLQLVTYIVGVLRHSTSFTMLGLLFALIPRHYFVMLYIVTYIFSPYINRLLSTLGVERQRQLVLLLLGVFSVWAYATDLLSLLFGGSLGQASPITSSGNQNGYTIVNFVLCYFAGAGLRRGAISIKNPAIAFIAASAAMLLIMRLSTVYLAIEYCSPFVIIQAAALLSFFAGIDIGSSKLINGLAKGVFTVYLLHFSFFPYIPVWNDVQQSPPRLLLRILELQVAIYLICWVIYFIYDKLTAPIFRMLWAKVKAPEINLDTIPQP